MLATLLQITQLIVHEYMTRKEGVGYAMTKNIASNCPNKPPNDINIIQDRITETDLPTIIDEPLLFDNMRREPTLQMVSFVNVNTKGTSRCVYLSATNNDKNVLCMYDADSGF